MTQILSMEVTDKERILKCCLLDSCEDTEEHESLYHHVYVYPRSIRGAIESDGSIKELAMTDEQIEREVKLLLEDEKRRLAL